MLEGCTANTTRARGAQPRGEGCISCTAQSVYSLRAMGNSLLIAHCIISCHIPGHLGVANHIDPWFYDVMA